MRFYRKKFILAIICLAASAALTWKLFGVVESTKETVTLVQASRLVEKGELIAADMLCRVEIGAYGTDLRAIKTEEGVIGKYAACDIYPGDILTYEKLKTLDEIADNFVQKTRDSRMSAVSVQLNGVSASLSGKLKTGDVVSAYVFVSQGGIGSNKGEVILYPELQCLEIAAVTNSRAEDIVYEPGRDIDYESMKVTGDAAIPATVVFIVNERQAIRLVEAENTGVIHLVFRGRGEYARELLSADGMTAAASVTDDFATAQDASVTAQDASASAQEHAPAESALSPGEAMFNPD